MSADRALLFGFISAGIAGICWISWYFNLLEAPADKLPLLLELSKFFAVGSIPFFALRFYAPEAKLHDVRNTIYAQEYIKQCTEILSRTHDARRSIDGLAKVAKETPQDLPTAGVEAFVSIASFCGGWRNRERLDRWPPRVSAALEEANRSLFDFLLTLEIQGSPPAAQIDSKAQLAIRALDVVHSSLSDEVRPKGL